jgi:hypothetical protein
VLKEEEEVGNAAGAPLLHERALHFEGLTVPHDSQAPDVQGCEGALARRSA